MNRPFKTHAAVTGHGSAFKRYRQLVVGRDSLWGLTHFECCQFLAFAPGALGLWLRSLFWPRLFGSCGQGVVFGEGMVLRHPCRIHLGHRVAMGEGCLLDARHQAIDRVLVIEDDVNLANRVAISCKEGSVRLGRGTGVGMGVIIHSAQVNPVVVGPDVVIGPMCYLVGGGEYDLNQCTGPIGAAPLRHDGGVEIEEGAWLGARVTVLGGSVPHVRFRFPDTTAPCISNFLHSHPSNFLRDHQQ